MLTSNTSKLIWQKNSPARFESAWCVFVKLLSLNVITSKELANLISNDENTINFLPFWSSTWIDFVRFSDLLDVDSVSLKTGYLDQLNVFTSNEPIHNNLLGIKLCPECAKIGYHCIIFQLGFIKYCPWHHVELEAPCYKCVHILTKSGLKEVQRPNWSARKSNCGHILFDEGKVPLSNMLSEMEETEINRICTKFMHWWGKVSTCVDVWKFLSKTYFSDADLDNLPKYLSAAESIAGTCPWFIETSKNDVRTICWKQSAPTKIPISESSDEAVFEPIDDAVPRKSEVDVAYRAIRRYLFRRFVKYHRCCWQELSNYAYFSVQDLSSDKACIITMAYIAWRLSVERFLNIEVLKFGELNDRPIVEFRLSHDEYVNSIEGQIALIYAHFFYVWEDIDRLSGEEKFGIALSSHRGDKSHFAVTYNFEEWLLIFPNHKLLELRSFMRCCGLVKYCGWMLEPNYTNQWFLDKNAEFGWNNSLIFKLHKYDKRAGYKYINV